MPSVAPSVARLAFVSPSSPNSSYSWELSIQPPGTSKPSHKGDFLIPHPALCLTKKPQKTLLPCSSIQAFVRLSSLMSNFLLSPDLIVFILAVLLIFPAVFSCYIELMFLNATEILGGAVLPENVEGEEDPGGYSVCLVRDAIIMTPEHSCHDTITSRTRSG